MSSRRRKNKHGLLPRPFAAMRRELVVTLESLEISVGTDGLLRGKPEPVILVGA